MEELDTISHVSTNASKHMTITWIAFTVFVSSHFFWKCDSDLVFMLISTVQYFTSQGPFVCCWRLLTEPTIQFI
jgi:hypothetical protein